MAKLSRKIRLVFITQALVAGLLVTIGTLVGGAWLSNSILSTRVAREAAEVWQALERDPQRPLPHSAALTTYFVPPGGDDSMVPAALRQLSPGQHRIKGDFRMAYVGERPVGRLYMLFAPGVVDRIVNGVSLLAILLSLLAISLLSWLGYRRCKRVIAPVSRLAEQVAHWDPRNPGVHDFGQRQLDGVDSDSSSEVEALSRALEAMATRMAEHMRRESNFTRDASHEFRTPLTVIRMAADLLAHQQGLDARGQRSVARISAASREMEEVLDALLILARDPALPVENIEVPVLEIVEDRIQMAREQLRSKPVEVHLQIDAVPQLEAPLRVLGVMVGQLLRNAVEYTEAGRILVRLDEDRIEISDTGIGMDPDTLQRAFEPFYRADISKPQSKGMGLPVVQRLAERFGWQLQLHSHQGSGTRASIVFAPLDGLDQARHSVA